MARELILIATLLVLGTIHETFALELEDLFATSRPAKPDEFPYQASLRNRNIHFCGGALISNQHVLTAAHCIVGVVEPPFNFITVVTGSVNFTGGERHIIRKVVVHPNYTIGVYYIPQNDIAIITLETPITPNAFQRPTRVASDDPPEGEKLSVGRWGWTSVGGALVPILKRRTSFAWSNELCVIGLEEEPVDDTILCASCGKETGVCLTNDGDPLDYNGEVVGIASLVYPCVLGMPDVYIRVSRYLDFINSIIKA